MINYMRKWSEIILEPLPALPPTRYNKKELLYRLSKGLYLTPDEKKMAIGYSDSNRKSKLKKNSKK